MTPPRTVDRTALDSAKKGSADLVILALVEERDLHGYDIARHIEERSGGTLHFSLASLYATLYRLEERHLVRGLEAAQRQFEIEVVASHCSRSSLTK